MSTKCIYFAYGSNLLSKRMHLLNPNAVRCGKGILNDYKLEFGRHTTFWDGTAANITEKVGQKVWGALWELKLEDICNLDKQEGVEESFYRPICVQIEIPNGGLLRCRTYQQVEKFEEVDLMNPPEERKPSKSYLNTIIKGAEETGLPIEYINHLKSIPANNSNHIPKFLQLN